MRLATSFATVLSLALLAGASAADDKSPTADENWRPPGYTGPPSPVIAAPLLLNDGSFENGPPPFSAWAETTTTICEWIGDHSAIFATSGYDGSNSFWAGGYCPLGVASINWVTQSVAVPAGTTHLSFWIFGQRLDPDDEGLDVAYIAVNGTEVWTRAMSMANNTGGLWINQTVSMSAYAGQTVQLKLGNRGAGLAGNLLFDYLEFLVPTPTRSGTWGRLKTLYR